MKKLLLLALICLLAAGCANRRRGSDYLVYVDAIAAPDALARKSYYIIPGEKTTNVDDLQYIEYKRYLTSALTETGLIASTTIDNADLVVYMSYGIGEPQTITQTYAAPIFGQTGVSSAQTYGTVSAFGGFSATTYYTPTWGVVGTTQRTKTTVSYAKSLVVDAYDREAMQSSNKLLQVWRASMTNTNGIGDMREAFPYLVAAMKPYIGENTYARKPVRIGVNHPSMINLRATRPLPISKTPPSPQATRIEPATAPAPTPCRFDANGVAICD